MAGYQAIAAASAAICGLIRERYPRQFGSLTVATYQYKDFEAGIAAEGFALLMWRLAINTQRRARGPRVDVYGRSFRPSLPVDLSFLIVPVTSGLGGPEKQLRMLGWLARALEDAGPLTAAQLNHYLEEQTVFADGEEVDLVCDPLPMADHLTLWDRMRKHPLHINYVMRMLLIDSEQPFEEGPPVTERAFGPLVPPVLS